MVSLEQWLTFNKTTKFQTKPKQKHQYSADDKCC